MKITDKYGTRAELTDSDLSDWHSFTQHVDPLDSKHKKALDRGNSIKRDKTNFHADELAFKPEPAAPGRGRSHRPKPLRKIPTQLLPIEEKLMKKLRNKDIRIEDQLDLHGYKQQEARRVLIQFLRNAQIKRYKFVLVITGKGDSRRDEFGMSATGVLRTELPRWLIQPDVFRLAAASSIAHSSDGGEGARYIQIRRMR